MAWRRRDFCTFGPDWPGAPILYPHAPSVKFGQLSIGLAKFARRPGTEPIGYRIVTERTTAPQQNALKVESVDWRAMGLMGPPADMNSVILKQAAGIAGLAVSAGAMILLIL